MLTWDTQFIYISEILTAGNKNIPKKKGGLIWGGVWGTSTKNKQILKLLDKKIGVKIPKTI